MKKNIPFYRQQSPYTCGPAVLRMALASFGIKKKEQYLARISETTRHGTSNFGLFKALRTLSVPYESGYRMRYRDLMRAVRRGTVIIDWMPQLIYPSHPEFQHSREFNPLIDAHYAIVISAATSYVTLQDPILGRRVRVSRREFLKVWKDGGTSFHWLLVLRKQ